MSNGKWLNDIAKLIKKDDGTYFLRFGPSRDKNGKLVGKDATNPFPMLINEGDIWQAKLRSEDLKGLVERGILTAEQAESIGKREKFTFSKGPGTAAKKVSSTPDDGVNF